MARILWEPPPETIARSNIGRSMAACGFGDYPSFYRWSITQPNEFWSHAIDCLNLCFDVPPEQILDVSRSVETPLWLPGARWNIANSCFSASPDSKAIHEVHADGNVREITYEDLNRLSAHVARGLRLRGLQAGSRIAVVLPMTAEAVAIYLGIIRAGMTVVSIADSFSSEQIAARLRIAAAEMVFTVCRIRRGSRALEIYDRVCEAAALPTVVIEESVGEQLRDGDQSWQHFLDAVSDLERKENLGGQRQPGESATGSDPISNGPDHPINILFSSGTTGDPKAIPWDQTTALKAAIDGYFHQDIQPGDVTAWPTNLGWMMGPWLIFATLINRGTIALYTGAPTEKGFGPFVSSSGVCMLGVVPSLVKSWRDSAAMDDADWTGIRLFSSTGECSQPDDMQWLSQKAGGKPIIEYCGGTEIGGAYITSTLVQPNIASMFSTPALGSEMLLLDESGEEADEGEVFLVPPALGLSRQLVNADHHQVYYAGTPDPIGRPLRRHGDHMLRTSNGYYQALGRADDTMNLGGIKVGAAEIERVISGVAGVVELAAIAVSGGGGGPSRLVVFVAGPDDTPQEAATIRQTMQAAIKSRLNPLFKLDEVVIVDHLPRTASNKIMRRKLRDLLIQRSEGRVS